MNDVLLGDRIQGEREIARFRIFVVSLSAIFVAIQVSSSGYLTGSNIADFSALGAVLIYTFIVFFYIKERGYKRGIGFVCSSLDVAIISLSVYFSRYAHEASLVSLATSANFLMFFPIILVSIRRHDPVNTLYTGLLAGAAYLGMIGTMLAEDSFGSVLRTADARFVLVNDLPNELVKVFALAVTGFIGFAAARNAQRLMDRAVKEQEDKDHLRTMFGKYVSEELVEKIMDKGIALDGERREVTVMFIDIKDFTGLAESAHPRTLIMILNEFFSICIKAIVANGGFIDKFIGDAVMVVFGAPDQDERHRDSALACALELERELGAMHDFVSHIDVDWDFGFGIGINTGEAIVGNIGTEQRLEYTALGDMVNTAARIEQLTRDTGDVILLGEKSVSPAMEGVLRGPISCQVKGKADPITVYAIA